MKLASFAFFLLLTYAHQAGDFDRTLAQPLSLFRDGGQAWVGYALFAVLLVIGWLYATALARSHREAEAAVAGLTVLLLVAVAVTPSWSSFHLFCSLLLLLLLFGYYARLLSRAARPLLFAHLAVPTALALATGFHSYGLWQKSLIAYFVAVAVTHHHLVGRLPRQGGPWPAGSRPRACEEPMKRRKVYRLEPGRAWAKRQKLARS
jgi:hypothetical protein